MNFFMATETLIEWTGPTAFLVVTAALILVPGAMYWWMRRRAWI
jgi:hypothetical protein